MDFHLDTLAKLGKFIGGFFVVVSPVYLGYQLRQNPNDRFDAAAVERWRAFVAGEGLPRAAGTPPSA